MEFNSPNYHRAYLGHMEKYVINSEISIHDRVEHCLYCGELGIIPWGNRANYISEGEEISMHKQCRNKYLKKLKRTPTHPLTAGKGMGIMAPDDLKGTNE